MTGWKSRLRSDLDEQELEVALGEFFRERFTEVGAVGATIHRESTNCGTIFSQLCDEMASRLVKSHEYLPLTVTVHDQKESFLTDFVVGMTISMATSGSSFQLSSNGSDVCLEYSWPCPYSPSADDGASWSSHANKIYVFNLSDPNSLTIIWEAIERRLEDLHNGKAPTD